MNLQFLATSRRKDGPYILSKPIRIKFNSSERPQFIPDHVKPKLKKKTIKFYERNDLPYKNYKYIKLNFKNTDFEYLSKLEKAKPKEKSILFLLSHLKKRPWSPL